MRHTLKLQPKYYEAVKNGIKVIELRLLDEKRKNIKLDDEIEFKKEPDLKESIVTKVKGILLYKSFEDILEFHVKFEKIHPFQDGNGRVGRLIMFKECLKYNIVPFIIEDTLKLFYYRGLKEWSNERGYLKDTCLTAQDKYKAYLDYFRIEY